MRFSVPVTVAMSVHIGAVQALGAGDDVAVLGEDIGAHSLQAPDVLVDRPRADGAASRQRHPRAPKRANRGPSTKMEARMVFTSS